MIGGGVFWSMCGLAVGIDERVGRARDGEGHWMLRLKRPLGRMKVGGLRAWVCGGLGRLVVCRVCGKRRWDSKVGLVEVVGF